MDTCNWIDMSSEYASTFSYIDVQQSAGGVKGTSCDVISCSVNIDAPDGLAVIFEGECTGGVDKIPYLYSAVSGSCEEMMASGMEAHGADPIFVALTGHDKFWLVNSPYFPEHVVTTCADNGFFGVKNDSGDRHSVTFLSLPQHSLFVVELFAYFRCIFFGEGGELGLFGLAHVGLCLNLW